MIVHKVAEVMNQEDSKRHFRDQYALAAFKWSVC